MGNIHVNTKIKSLKTGGTVKDFKGTPSWGELMEVLEGHQDALELTIWVTAYDGPDNKNKIASKGLKFEIPPGGDDEPAGGESGGIGSIAAALSSGGAGASEEFNFETIMDLCRMVAPPEDLEKIERAAPVIKKFIEGKKDLGMKDILGLLALLKNSSSQG